MESQESVYCLNNLTPEKPVHANPNLFMVGLNYVVHVQRLLCFVPVDSPHSLASGLQDFFGVCKVALTK